jgi:hypothetical protein
VNASTNAKIDAIVRRAHPSVREELASHLSACCFEEPNDPGLNALVAQSMLLDQADSGADPGERAVATEAGLARLGDRLEGVAWTLKNQKLGTFILACVLSIGLGAGGVALAFKMWAPALSDLFSLPKADDGRIKELSKQGAVLHVETEKGRTYVWLEGPVQIGEAQGKNGLNYLYFSP